MKHYYRVVVHFNGERFVSLPQSEKVCLEALKIYRENRTNPEENKGMMVVAMMGGSTTYFPIEQVAITIVPTLWTRIKTTVWRE